ncbi:PaaI family thioesterase [Bdellovibrio sp. SKB1291214]|uniref:PaaI family thioesterase n=1 Tax=Bdellovibrio sp. SKB1291214 TaxID=1732569 RepID=UPI000B517C85|nr:PaaI family thioesterase [Bdellovibrio sp. SKB1291214]UYL07746.1 PaaI family thioesterase [Bdellovibrio sp. SKB1291214]
MTQISQPNNPFLEHMGIKLIKWSEGAAEFEMPIQTWHMNRQGALQGGVVSTLVDAACSYAGFYSPPGSPEVHGVTITLNVNFVSSTKQGTLHAKAKKIGGGKNIFFSEAEVYADDGALIASGQGSFKYRR